MKIKTSEVLKMADEIYDIFHRHKIIVKRDTISLAIFEIIRVSNPNENVEYDKGDLA